MDAAAELGRNPASKHQIQPEYGDEQADAGQDGRTHLVRSNSQARTWTGKCSCFPVQLTTRCIGNNSRLIHTLLKVLTIHILLPGTYNMYILYHYPSNLSTAVLYNIHINPCVTVAVRGGFGP